MLQAIRTIAAAILVILGAASARAEVKQSTLLVLGIKGDNYDASKRRIVDELILTAVQRTVTDSKVLSPDDLQAVIGLEKMRDAAGCDDMACAAEIGAALGAQRLLTGNIGVLGDQVIVTLKLIDVVDVKATARARGSAPVAQEAELVGLVEKLVGELFPHTSAAGAAAASSADRGGGAAGASAPGSPPAPGPRVQSAAAHGDAAGATAAPASAQPVPGFLVTVAPEPARQPRSKTKGWILLAAGVVLAAGSLAFDVAAPTSKNGAFDAVDVLPLAGYTAATTGLIWGIVEVAR